MFHRLQDWTRTLAEAALPQAAIILVAIPPAFSSFRWWILGPDLGPNKFSSHLGDLFHCGTTTQMDGAVKPKHTVEPPCCMTNQNHGADDDYSITV